ncbi:MAG: PAS domain S-box protein [Isosphaeraceae bacterium]|nr:PAS domain S-box protein [Isosphaeraceae bacterium]
MSPENHETHANANNGGDDGGDEQFEALLEFLRCTRGFDFTGYKRSSLRRRIDKRMALVGVQGYEHYMDYLEVHPEEFARLFDTILINVTAFFRDPPAWEVLRTQILPRIVAAKQPDEPIRVWSAGCASGEEAYTLAMVLAEVVGLEQVRDRVKIYATDADEGELAVARHALYDERQVESVPPELREKYFEQLSGRYSFHKELRRAVIFGRHDLIQDAPISRIDLLVCRNTLMYLNQETQARILERFHYALNDRGFLFLGKAETLLTYNTLFAAVDLKRRIFAKVPRGNTRERLFNLVRSDQEEAVNHLVSHVRLREAAFDTGIVAQVVVDFSGLLALANERARALFGLNPSDFGRPLQDLPLSYRPADLRSLIDRAYSQRQPVLQHEVEWTSASGGSSFFDIYVVPLVNGSRNLLGASISFLDVTAVKQLKEDLQHSHRELETAYEELQSTNEELETTNEELQSTVEELETTNEELQSTNEELETMNEELQSTNEELETVNEELRRRGDELNQINTYLQSILASFPAAVVVLDRDFVISIWSPKAEDLWGLRAEEVRGKNLLSLDINLPIDQLRPVIRAALAGEAPIQQVRVQAINRRGRPIHCQVTCTSIKNDGRVTGAILLMEGAELSPPPTKPTSEAD